MDIELIRATCLALPHATESIKWDNNLVFSIGGKMFCITNLDDAVMLSMKTDAATREAWQERAGVVPAPYLARAGWIQLQTPAQCSKQELQHLIQQSYQLVLASLPRKQQHLLLPAEQNPDGR